MNEFIIPIYSWNVNIFCNIWIAKYYSFDLNHLKFNIKNIISFKGYVTETNFLISDIGFDNNTRLKRNHKIAG